MKETSEFRRNAEEAIRTLHHHLKPLGDDFDFEARLGPDGLELEFDASGDPISVTIHAGQQQVWVVNGSVTNRLSWDVVENSFVLEATGQTLQEVLGEAVSNRVGEDVSL